MFDVVFVSLVTLLNNLTEKTFAKFGCEHIYSFRGIWFLRAATSSLAEFGSLLLLPSICYFLLSYAKYGVIKGLSGQP